MFPFLSVSPIFFHFKSNKIEERWKREANGDNSYRPELGAYRGPPTASLFLLHSALMTLRRRYNTPGIKQIRELHFRKRTHFCLIGENKE